MTGFIFGGNTPWSYDQLQQKRKIAAELMAANSATPRNVGEGLHAIGRAISARGMEKRADKRDAELRGEFEAKLGALLGASSAASYAPAPSATPAPVDPNSPHGIAGDTMKALGKTPSLPQSDEVTAYIASAAKARGIDPQVALAVARSEGLNANPAEAWQSNVVKGGKREESYGPFQLYMGGGLGNQFVAQTGLDPRDASTWQKQVDFALDHAKSKGWGSWYGAANSGIGDFQGIGGNGAGNAGPETVTPAGMDIGTIAELLANPYADPGQKAILGALLQQRMDTADPMKRIEMERAQLELDAMRNPQVKATDDMREYEFARSQGYGGTFQQFMTDMKKAGASTQTVNVGDGAPGIGKLSTDYGYVFDPATGKPKIDEITGLPMAAPVPGSPAAVEAERLKGKASRTKTQGNLKLGTTLESLNLNIADIENGGLPVTGAIGDARRTWLGRALTGSGAVDFGNRTSQITDSAAFAEIQNMRDNSPTGGAVGQLTDPERVAIGNAITALNDSTSSGEYLRAAKAYRDLSLDLAYGEGQWALDENGQVQAATGAPVQGNAPAQITDDAGYDALPSGAEFIGPDGKLRRKP